MGQLMKPDYLNGDGRNIIRPINAPETTRPKSLRRSMARLLIKNFLERGRSTHTADGQTVWLILDYCRANKLSFTSTWVPYLGWKIDLKPKRV